MKTSLPSGGVFFYPQRLQNIQQLADIMMVMKIGQEIYCDSNYWEVVMLTSTYATIERKDNPKISKMIRL